MVISQKQHWKSIYIGLSIVAAILEDKMATLTGFEPAFKHS